MTKSKVVRRIARVAVAVALSAGVAVGVSAVTSTPAAASQCHVVC